MELIIMRNLGAKRREMSSSPKFYRYLNPKTLTLFSGRVRPCILAPELVLLATTLYHLRLIVVILLFPFYQRWQAPGLPSLFLIRHLFFSPRVVAGG